MAFTQSPHKYLSKLAKKGDLLWGGRIRKTLAKGLEWPRGVEARTGILVALLEAMYEEVMML